MTIQSLPSTFADRHIGARRQADIDTMLKNVGYDSVDGLVDTAVPASIRQENPLLLTAALSEVEVLAELRRLAGKNKTAVQMIGLGYYGTFTPPVILRNVMENPAWYTAYTPYQPEISQGRLEALLNFQTVVAELTGLPTSGASLLDEGTAAAEAMTLARRVGKAKGNVFLVDADALPQTIAVIQTRAEPIGIDVVVADLSEGIPAEIVERGVYGVLVQYPGASGAVREIKPVIEQAHGLGAIVAVSADLLALTLLTSPGELGADIAVGTTQRFGVPMGFGGPHAGYMAVQAKHARSLPGRLVGVSVDADGNKAYRLALQTREQHIRREKATSNICTAQVLLAVMAGMYAVYHGPDGLRTIARRTHRYANLLAAGLTAGGVEVVHGSYFDTLTVRVQGRAAEVVAAAREGGVNLFQVDADLVSIACDETTLRADIEAVWAAFGVTADIEALDEGPPPTRCPRGCCVRGRVPDPPGLPPAPVRDRDAALPAQALGQGLRAGPRHDPAGLLHHEAQRDHRDGVGHLARIRPGAPVRPGRAGRGVPHAHHRAGGTSLRGHRLRQGLHSAERRFPG
jgi:glycine dehydrogenase